MDYPQRIVHTRIVLKHRDGKLASICDFPVSDPVKALRRMEGYLKRNYSNSMEAHDNSGGSVPLDTEFFDFLDGDYTIEIQPLVFVRKESV